MKTLGMRIRSCLRGDRVFLLLAISWPLLFASACQQTLEAGQDGGGPDAGQATSDGYEPEPQEPDGGTVEGEHLPGEGDGSGAGFENLFLSSELNGWAVADQSWAFEKGAEGDWILTASFPEGLVRFRLCAGVSCTPSFGTARLLHHQSSAPLEESGQPAVLLSLAEGSYRLVFHEDTALLEVSLQQPLPPPPEGLDADPRKVDNRSAAPSLVEALQGTDEQAQAALVSFHRKGGLPIRGGRFWHFLLLRPSGGTPFLAGTHNGWDPQAQPMEKVTSGGLYYASVPSSEAPLAYKFVQDGDWFSDPGNPHVEWDGIPVAGPGEFNSTLPEAAAARTNGRLVRWTFCSAAVGDCRDVFVYLPRAYDIDGTESFPLMVVHDGNESITRARFDAEAD
ncbi:MAG: hypothetical protein D6806_00420, partial [Deltaproteobacteria bacterium]